MVPSRALKEKVEAVLRRAFGEAATIHVLDGHLDNIHVWIASLDFQGVPEYIRQDKVWDVIDAELADHEKVKLSLVMAFSPDEPEYLWAIRQHDLASK